MELAVVYPITAVLGLACGAWVLRGLYRRSPSLRSRLPGLPTVAGGCVAAAIFLLDAWLVGGWSAPELARVGTFGVVMIAVLYVLYRLRR